MGIADGHVPVHFEVKLNVIIQAGFTGKDFFDSQCAGYAKSNAANLVHPALFRHDVH